MEVIIAALISFVIGAITTKVVLKINQTNDEPVGDLYLNDSELFLNLDEDITDKKYITLRVVRLNSHK